MFKSSILKNSINVILYLTILSTLVMATVLSLNVKGLVSHKKQLSLFELAKTTRANIMFLQETNLQHDSVMFHPQDYKFYINLPTQASSGVAIAMQKQFSQENQVISHQILVPGYLQTINIKIQNENYHLVNVYMPQSVPLGLQVLQKIEFFLANIEDSSKIIIGGDWNVTLEQNDRINCTESKTELVNKMKLILHQYQLSDVWRSFNPSKKQYSFRGLQQNHPMSRIDRFYIKNRDLNLVRSTAIIPSFSDHSAITIAFNTSRVFFKPPYWKMDLAALKSKQYQEIIINIISHFEARAEIPESNINKLWDELKQEIQIASQRFMKYFHLQAKEKLNTLQAQINYIQSKTEMTRKDEEFLLQIEKEINNLYKTNSKSSLIQMESQMFNEANCQSKFFLRLTKQSMPSVSMDQLEVDGQVTNDKKKIFSYVQERLKESFANENINPVQPDNILYQNLPSLSLGDRNVADSSTTLQDIEDSISKAQLNRAPGMDGIPIEFYKMFWPQLKNIFMKIVSQFEQTGELPSSMKKIVIKHLPKNGDRNLLKNWRPISLMNSDYKILSRVYSKKIASVIDKLLTSDQSYCVPARTIYDNLHLLRNTIRHSNLTNSPLAILSLDQTEAFNNVSHQYLLHLLKIQGFGPKLCNAVKSLLSNTKGYVKIGSALLQPFDFKKGFRQGDPIAGPLYILSIEPFLKYACNQIIGYPIPLSTNKTAKCTAFADDLNFFIVADQDFEKIDLAFQLYSQQSGAKLNQAKSNGILCGSWKSRLDNPQQYSWNNEGSRFLGVHLGNNKKYEDKNWEDLTLKIKGTLNNWSQYVKLTSYQGRKIICNQLIGSQLIHVVNVLHPPRVFIQEIQTQMNNFLWQGKHWLHKNILYASRDKGGLELINLHAKVNSLRLSLANRIQEKFNTQEPTFLFHHYNLSKYGNISPPLFFCQTKQELEMANLEVFYQSLLSAWHNLTPILITKTFSTATLRKMPLYGSMIADQNFFQIIPEWKQCGYITLEKMLEEDGSWKTLQMQHHSISTQRRLAYNYNQIKNYFSKKIDHQLSNQENHPIKFQFKGPNQEKKYDFPSTKKVMYLSSLQPLITAPPVEGKSKLINKKIFWKSIYTGPSDKKDSDIAWRLLYDALVTPRKLQQWNVIQSKLCPWCTNKEGNVIHMIFLCKMTAPIWKYASTKIGTINETTSPLSFEQAVTGFPQLSPKSRLSNFLLTLVKSTIYRTYMNTIKDPVPAPPPYLKIFKRRLDFRIKTMQSYAKITNNEENFTQQFLINNALEDHLL